MIQLEHNILKNSNRPEANQLASFFKAYVAKKANSGATVKQIQVVVRVGIKPGTAGLRVRSADQSSKLPPAIHTLQKFTLITFNKNILVAQ